MSYKVRFHIPCTVNVAVDDRSEAMLKAFCSVDTMEREGIKFKDKVAIAIHPAIVDSIEELKQREVK